MKRRSPAIERKKRIFLGCEGESEQGYGAFLQRLADDEDLPIHLVIRNLQPAGNPMLLAKNAIRLSEKENRKAELAGKAIMFDTDHSFELEKHGCNEVRKILSRGGFMTILQYPDHEGLLLRHFAGHEHDNPPKGSSMDKLKTLWPNYHKNMPAAALKRDLSLENVIRAAKVTEGLKLLLAMMGLAHKLGARRGKPAR